MKITRKFRLFISASVQNLIDFVFPNVCPCCNKSIENYKIFCTACFSKIKFIQGTICYRCGKKLNTNLTEEKTLCANCLKKRPIYDKARSVFEYNLPSKNMILKFKYTGKIEYVYPFVKLMQQAGKDLFKETDVIMPVPMHWKRRLTRGYNQAGLLAQELAKQIKCPYDDTTLTRFKHTKKQENKSLEERNKNVKDAFKITDTNKVKNKTILLIDDVLTTGATVNNCTKTLKKAGAKAVFVLTIAHTTKND